MSDLHGIGSYGIVPFLSEDLLKQAKYGNIKTRAGKMAYLLTMGEKAGKPQVKEGIYESRGALKWIADVLSKEEEKKYEK